MVEGVDFYGAGAAIPNTGSLTWTATAPASSGCLVRVEDAAAGPLDETDAAFTITEPLTLTLSQVSAAEDAGTLGIGTVAIPTSLAAPLAITLVSDDSTEATVPGTVTILAGQTLASFDVTVINDSLIDDDHAVTVTANS